MDFGIFNLMGAREPDKSAAQVFAEVAAKLEAEIRALEPAHFCFAFKVGSTPHATAMRSTERFMTEVKPRLERALGPLDRIGVR